MKIAVMMLCMLAAAAGWADPASACRSAAFSRPILHPRIPDRLAAEAIVAEVQFARPDREALYTKGIEAKVTRLLRGTLQSRTILVRGGKRSSCSSPFSRGLAGILVAVPRTIDGRMVYEAVEGPRRGARRSRAL
jgi:hypothetical protein